MSTKEILAKFEELVHYYLDEIDRYTPEQFTKKPSDKDWSFGQMLQHLLDFANLVQLPAIEACAAGKAQIGGEKTEFGERAFAEGSFPPIQIKLPDKPQFTPANPANKQEVKEQLQTLLETLREWEPKLSSIPPDSKVKHMGFGYLNAVEWFQLNEMHFRHHLHQKKRIDEWLRSEAHE